MDNSMVSEFLSYFLLANLCFGGAIFLFALMRQWGCSKVVCVLIAATWYVTLPCIGWLLLVPMLDSDVFD